MSQLEDAIQLALDAHSGQLVRNGRPYIVHPLRLMTKMATDVGMTAAVLHDVVEDTDITLEDLRERGFSEEVVEVVDLMTHREEDSYEVYVERLAPHPIARRLKIADLEDNMDIRRLIAIRPQRDMDRFAKYLKAWKRLQAFEQGDV